MHPTSLPGRYGIGDMGREAYAFVDWLASAKMQIWQVLPLVPPGRPIPGIREDYWSPYSGRDAHCGNTLIISLDELVKEGLLASGELPEESSLLSNVDFQKVAEVNEPLISIAARRLLNIPNTDPMKLAFNEWRVRLEISSWLNEAALFDAICHEPDNIGKDWWDWPDAFRRREPAALEAKRAASAAYIDEFCATQFIFDRQWLALKNYANLKGISIVGDMPIYVGGHSADVWANQALFSLGPDCKPLAVAGVPPDAFSEDGQLWGSPLYDWPMHDAHGYKWWAGRLGRALELHDEVRIDHFRAFAAYWSVPADAKTAKSGEWIVGPGEKFFKGIKDALGDAPIVAEDLGVITKDVVELREAIGAPGMVVLQFAWGGSHRRRKPATARATRQDSKRARYVPIAVAAARRGEAKARRMAPRAAATAKPAGVARCGYFRSRRRKAEEKEERALGYVWQPDQKRRTHVTGGARPTSRA